MTNRVAASCSEPSCRRPTKDSSGRCPWHRAADTRKPIISSVRIPKVLASPPSPTFTPSSYSLPVKDGAHFEEWKTDGRAHRIGAPATISIRADGTTESEWWYRDNREHRVDGPAYVEYEKDGSVKLAEWHFAGRAHTGPTGVAMALRKLSSGDLLTELSTSGYVELLEEGVEPDEIVDALYDGVYSVEGIREVIDGAPAEWVRAFEESRS